MKVRFTVGDWSEDGHSYYQHDIVETNYPVERMQQAYFDSCKKIGYRFDHSHQMPKEHLVLSSLLTNYTDDNLPPEFMDVMQDHHCDLEMLMDFDYARANREEDQHITPEEVTAMMLIVLTITMPKDWVYELIKSDPMPQFNGYWSDTLNVQIGYGTYQD